MSITGVKKQQVEPYAPLFFVGLASAILGSILWVAFQAHWISFYPRQAHASLMFSGFLLAFVSGFLMTAIPKMTAAPPATRFEWGGSLLLVLFQWVLNFNNQIHFSVALFLIQLVFLLLFIVRRFLVTKRLPFEGFVFMPFAFACAIWGVIDYFFVSKDFASFSFVAGQGLVLNLICGIGSRLVPVLTRVPQALNPDEAGEKSKIKIMLFFAVWLNLSFLLESLNYKMLAMLLRFSFLLVYSVLFFKVLKKPTVRAYLSWGIRISLAFLVFGYLFAGLWGEALLPLIHLSFIGGFSLVTLMVATRVTLAHGGAGINMEIDSKMILVVVISLVCSAVVRSIVLNDVASYLVSASAIFFALGFIFWILKFGKILASVFSR